MSNQEETTEATKPDAAIDTARLLGDRGFLYKVFIYSCVPFYGIYHYLTRRAYYVTGTFIDNNGTRMFCKTVFFTSMYRMPMKSLSSKMAEQFGVSKPVLILNFVRIPWGQAKYMQEENDGVKIEMSDA